MKKLHLKWLYSLVFLFFSLTLSGCDFVGDVLEFGLWTILIILVILILIIYFIFKLLGGGD